MASNDDKQVKQFLVAYNYEFASFRREIGDFSSGAIRACSKSLGTNLVFTAHSGFFIEQPEAVKEVYPHLSGVVVYRDPKMCKEIVKTCKPLGIPVLIYGSSSYAEESDTPHYVATHEEEIVRRALEYLWEKGHRRIGSLVTGGPAHLKRMEIWKEWMQAREQPAGDDVILNAPKGKESEVLRDLEALKAYSQKVTATFCTDESCLAVFIDAMYKVGVSLPGDMSIVSVNNSAISEAVKPACTSIYLPQEDHGQLCMEFLMNLAGGSRIPIRETGKVRLVERESVVAPRK